MKPATRIYPPSAAVSAFSASSKSARKCPVTNLACDLATTCSLAADEGYDACVSAPAEICDNFKAFRNFGAAPSCSNCAKLSTTDCAFECFRISHRRFLSDSFSERKRAPAMIVRTVMAFLAVGLLLSKPAVAVTGSVSKIVVQIATDAELEEAIGPRGTLVQRASDPKDLRILDGYTPGGVSIRNFAALTNPPPDYDRDVNMHAHHVRLDGSYSINAEAGRMSAWYGTNAFLQILAASSASENAMLSVAAEGTNMVFTVAATNDNVVVETSASLESPVWTEAPFVLERLSPLTVKIKVAEPPVGEIRFVRVQTTSGDVGMVLSIPLSVPSLAVGGADVTAESIAAWNASYGWGDHADAGYLEEESDPNFSAWLGGSPLDDYVPISIVNSNYYVDMCPDDSRHTIIKVGGGYEVFFKEDDVSYNGTLLWRNENGVNRHFGPITVAANTTNNFIRPDGGTNTISFDANFNMIVSVDGVVSLCVATNGNVGIRRLSEVNYALTLNGAIKSSASITGSIIYDTSGGGSVDPSGISTMGGIILTNVPTDTNGLPSGRIYNSSGVLKVMP